MRHSELHYRQNEYSPRYRTNPSSLNGNTEERIVMLYTSGNSVDSIVKEVGRARHRVVHVLQTRGVFGNGQTEGEEHHKEPHAVMEAKEKLSVIESKPKTAAVKPSTKKPRRSKSPGKALDKLEPTLSAL